MFLNIINHLHSNIWQYEANLVILPHSFYQFINMTPEEAKRLKSDPDGLLSYEYIANHIEDCDPADLNDVIENLVTVDLNGQFTASAARYLNAIDAVRFADAVARLAAATIDKDREHRYLPDLLTGVYGPDCHSRADELSKSDNNFRRIYKRLFPNPDSL